MTPVNQSPTFLPSVSPSSLGGNASTYQEKMNGGAQRKGAQRGGQGYGYEGKMIAPGVAEVSSYKGGKRNSKRRNSKRNSKRRNSKRQNKSRRQRKY